MLVGFSLHVCPSGIPGGTWVGWTIPLDWVLLVASCVYPLQSVLILWWFSFIAIPCNTTIYQFWELNHGWRSCYIKLLDWTNTLEKVGSRVKLSTTVQTNLICECGQHQCLFVVCQKAKGPNKRTKLTNQSGRDCRGKWINTARHIFYWLKYDFSINTW